MMFALIYMQHLDRSTLTILAQATTPNSMVAKLRPSLLASANTKKIGLGVRVKQASEIEGLATQLEECQDEVDAGVHSVKKNEDIRARPGIFTCRSNLNIQSSQTRKRHSSLTNLSDQLAAKHRKTLGK